ncbi:MAG: polyphosphate kinase 1 [Chloroflexia bacterium]
MGIEELTTGQEPEVLVVPRAELKPNQYFNRELSLLEFNRRVLEEALTESNRLLERLKFLSIFNSNMDEFFMIRVSGIREQLKAGVNERSVDGMTPGEEMSAIRLLSISLFETQSAFFLGTLRPELSKAGINICDYDELTEEQKLGLRDYFENIVFPVCTPLAVDPGHPFPHISNLSLNLAVELQDPGGLRHFARVKVPNVLPRLVPLPAATGDSRRNPTSYVWLEQVLSANLGALFPQMHLLQVHPFRVLRDADLEIQELEADDLLESVEQSVARRRFGSAVALFMNRGMPDHLRSLLIENLELDDNDVYTIDGPLGLSNLMELYQIDRSDLKDPPFTPRIPRAIRETGNIFGAIQRCDILLHHPFDSFNPVVDFIRTAAADKDVLAIKQTLYRVGSHSPIVEALLEAAEAGKQVAVLVELKARFDEENNIEWARALEQAGVHVTYGLIGLKTHCKVALVVRKEGEGIRRYVHLGTGNYNPATARLYTDMAMFTCRPDIGADVSELFNYLTGYSKQTKYRKLLLAPITLRSGILALIEREIKRHRDHGDGRLIFKMNGLVDPACIEALYRASQAGVQIDIIVRRMCCLRPGMARLSKNIRVTSVVGRFLEHSRIYYFRNGGKEEMLMGSADLMPRNLDNRVETLFPVEDEGVRNYIVNEVLEAYLRDTSKARLLRPDGTYVHVQLQPNTPPFDVQASLTNQLAAEAEVGVPLSALPRKYRKYLSGYEQITPQG